MKEMPEKGSISFRESGKIRERIADLGSRGSGGPFLLKILSKESPESSVELFCFIIGKTETRSFHDLEIFGRVHGPQNQYYVSLETPNHNVSK